MEPAKQNIQQKSQNILIEVENAKVSRLIQAEQKLEDVAEGKFEIIMVEEENQQIHFLKVGNFKYTIYKQLPIYVTQYDTYRSFIFPIIEGFYVILIEDKYAENYDILDSFFDHTATQIFQNPDGSVKQQQQEDNQTPDGNEQQVQKQEKQEIQEKEPVKQLKQEQQQKQEESKEEDELNAVGKVIFKAGNMVSNGIIKSAQIISSGIQKTGDYVESKIKETKEVQIKPETMQRAENIKNHSGKVMKVSAATCGQLVSMNMKMAQMAGQQIIKKVNKEEDKHGVSKNEKYEYVKEVGRQTIDSSLSVLQALEEAATFIARQLGQSSRQVIRKKYGEQAAQLADIGIDAAGNVGNTYKDVKGIGVKKLAKAAAKETAKETARNI